MKGLWGGRMATQLLTGRPCCDTVLRTGSVWGRTCPQHSMRAPGELCNLVLQVSTHCAWITVKFLSLGDLHQTHLHPLGALLCLLVWEVTKKACFCVVSGRGKVGIRALFAFVFCWFFFPICFAFCLLFFLHSGWVVFNPIQRLWQSAAGG